MKEVYSRILDMIEVNEELTRKVAELARLDLSKSEVISFTHQIEQILKYIDKLSEVDAKNVLPLTHPLDMDLQFREDTIITSSVDELGKPKILKNAPEIMYDGFKVPPII